MSKRETFIKGQSAALHVPESIVRLIVERWELERKTAGGASHDDQLVAKGGGWFILPDGRKIQGRDAALAALGS